MPQCQSSHLGTHAVVVQPLPYGLIRLVLTCTGGRSNEDLFQTVIAIVVQAASRNRLSTPYDPAGFHLVFRAHVRDDLSRRPLGGLERRRN